MSSAELFAAAGFMLVGLAIVLSGGRGEGGRRRKSTEYRIWAATVLAVVGLSLLTLYLNGFYYF